MEMCEGTIFQMNNNQVLPEGYRHGVANWESMLKHSCLINRRKKVRDARETNWGHEAKQGKTILDMSVDVEITPTYNILFAHPNSLQELSLTLILNSIRKVRG